MLVGLSSRSLHPRVESPPSEISVVHRSHNTSQCHRKGRESPAQLISSSIAKRTLKPKGTRSTKTKETQLPERGSFFFPSRHACYHARTLPSSPVEPQPYASQYEREQVQDPVAAIAGAGALFKEPVKHERRNGRRTVAELRHPGQHQGAEDDTEDSSNLTHLVLVKP